MGFLQKLFSKKAVDNRKEEPRFLKALVNKYGRGTEFKARDAFNMISEDYLNWYIENAQARRIYAIDWTETATLELLESLLNKGLLKNKRVEIINDYGDECWYYTLS